MNTSEIRSCMERDHWISKTEYGVYARDQLPPCDVPGLFILNTDTSDQRVSHWILVYIDQNCNGHVFDSLGTQQTYWKKICNAIHGITVLVTPMRLQGMRSQMCGGYALFFARGIAKGGFANFDELLQPFSTLQSEANDALVQKHLWSRYQHFLPLR